MPIVVETQTKDGLLKIPRVKFSWLEALRLFIEPEQVPGASEPGSLNQKGKWVNEVSPQQKKSRLPKKTHASFWISFWEQNPPPAGLKNFLR